MKKILQTASLAVLVILMVSLTAGCIGENAAAQKQKIGPALLIEGEEYPISGTDYSFTLRDASIYGTSGQGHYQAVIDIYEDRQYIERFHLGEGLTKVTISNIEITLISSGDKSAEFTIYKTLG